MLQNAYSLAKIGADTAENERHFAENLPKIGNYPTVVSFAPLRTVDVAVFLRCLLHDGQEDLQVALTVTRSGRSWADGPPSKRDGEG